jgi:outer membrane protein OmpA-like peptidoglycan-associated protein
VTLNRLAPGPHVFEARQTDGVGNVGPVAVHRWTVRVGAAAPGVPGAPAKAATPVVPTRTAVQEDGTAVVGCAVDQPTLRSCVVRLTHKGADGREVVVGQVTVQAATGRASVAAPVRLTAAGRRMLRVAGGGLPVTVAVDARVASGQVLRSVRRSVLTAPQRVLAPVVGPFVAGTARFDARIRADVRAAAALLRGARSVTCAGHTDSRGTDAFSRALGLRRAQAVCAALRDAGVRARTTAESAGEDRPRASNRTARGRALNRRVELTARF